MMRYTATGLASLDNFILSNLSDRGVLENFSMLQLLLGNSHTMLDFVNKLTFHFILFLESISHLLKSVLVVDQSCD